MGWHTDTRLLDGCLPPTAAACISFPYFRVATSRCIFCLTRALAVYKRRETRRDSPERQGGKEENTMAHATFTAEGQNTESFRLLSGHKIPAVGLGTWRSGSQATHAVVTALVEVIHETRIIVYCTI